MAVLAQYKAGKKFYSGVITRKHKDGTFTVQIEDGELMERLAADCLKVDDFKKGQKVYTAKSRLSA
jgi:hypothetical protein